MTITPQASKLALLCLFSESRENGMLQGEWFTEICPESGSAFSLKCLHKLHEEKTQYQTIEIYQTEKFGQLMVIDGFVMLSSRDNFFYHEMMTHPALYRHPEPKRVLIIGGGDCGSLQQVLKHETIQQVWQVEIDERVTRVAEKYFPELCSDNDDPRVRFQFGDGIAWVENASDDSVDVIIVDSTDPIGPAEGLFREPFYKQCMRVLGPQGILVQQSESPLIHGQLILAMRNAMQAAGAGFLQTLSFPQCVYPTGWWSATLASRSSLQDFRHEDEKRRRFETRYYNAAIHHASTALPNFLATELAVNAASSE